MSVDACELATRIKSKGPAPVHLWNPPFCGDIDMRIAKDGTWFHEGEPIRRQSMVKLFSNILLYEAEEYFLVTPSEKLRIKVEDCPFVVLKMDIEGSGIYQQILLTTNTEETIVVDQDHAIEMDSFGKSNEPHPIVNLRNGLNALINRPVFYRLVETAVERNVAGSTHLGVWSAGILFSLGSLF